MRRTIIGLLPAAILFAFLVSPAAALAGGGCFRPVTQGTGTTVDLTGICFSPTVLYVRPGDTVTWINRDSLDHVISGASLLWSSEGTLHAGQSLSYQFLTPGIYPYTCTLHVGMSGAVVVGDDKMTSAPAVNVASAAGRQAAPTGGLSAGLALLLVLVTGIAGFALGRFLRRQPDKRISAA